VVFLGDLVEASEVDAKPKRTVYLPNEKDWSLKLHAGNKRER